MKPYRLRLPLRPRRVPPAASRETARWKAAQRAWWRDKAAAARAASRKAP